MNKKFGVFALLGLLIGILSVTEVIFEPHFQGRELVGRVAGKAGFREVGYFGKRLAYTMHFEKIAQ